MAITSVGGSSPEYNENPEQVQVNNAGQQQVNSVWAEFNDADGIVDTNDVKYNNCNADNEIQTILEENQNQPWTEILKSSIFSKIEHFNSKMNMKAKFDRATNRTNTPSAKSNNPLADYERRKQEALENFNKIRNDSLNKYEQGKQNAENEYNQRLKAAKSNYEALMQEKGEDFCGSVDESKNEYNDFKDNAITSFKEGIKNAAGNILDKLKNGASGFIRLGNTVISYNNQGFIADGNTDEPLDEQKITDMINDAIEQGVPMSGYSEEIDGDNKTRAYFRYTGEV